MDPPFAPVEPGDCAKLKAEAVRIAVKRIIAFIKSSFIDKKTRFISVEGVAIHVPKLKYRKGTFMGSVLNKLSISIVAWASLMSSAGAIDLSTFHLPPGFHIEVFIPDLKGARSMTLGSRGTLFVGTRESKVYAITPQKKVYIIAQNLNEPNGVAFKDGALYVAEINRIIKFEKIEENLEKPPTLKVINDSYPSDQHHGWKFIAFGPDQKLYVPIGAPCNVCEVKDPYASITRIQSDGSQKEVFARGVRNTVGFDWHPVTHELWFTDNGRDLLGDDLPPDELNRAPKLGLNFGFPFCHGGEIIDPDFGKNKNCADFTAPEQKFGAHVASLGMRFYTGNQFSPEYKNQIFIAEHGSWNRSTPIGYRISLVKLGASGHPVSYEIFAQGWLSKSGRPIGRPVDVLVAADGSLLVSDDFANCIYRISYKK
jgi:glucose/arabinose dehydrogenase